MKTLFKKFRKSDLEFCIGNSIQIGNVPEIEDPKISICIEFPIEYFGTEPGIFSNGFCTFHAVKPCSEIRFSKFWILRDRVHFLFPTRLRTSPYSQRLRIDQLFKMIGENAGSLTSVRVGLHMVLIIFET